MSRLTFIITAAALLALAASGAVASEESPHTRAGGATALAPPVPAPTSSRKIDEYGNISWSDEKARLDNYAIELQNDPTALGYIIGYAGRVARVGEARRRMERAKKYLISVHKIAPERVVTVDGGHREDLTIELWTPPANSTPPIATPTVDPSEVRIIKDKPKAKRRKPTSRRRR